MEVTGGVWSAAMFSAQQSIEASLLGASVIQQAHAWGSLDDVVPGLRMARKIIRSDVVPSFDELEDYHLYTDSVTFRETQLRVDHGLSVAAAVSQTAAEQREAEEGEEGLVPSIRRHRPRSLMRKFKGELYDQALPAEEWCVSLGIDLTSARTLVKRATQRAFGSGRDVRVLPRAPIVNQSGKKFSRFAFLVGEDEWEIVPELYAKLALYAAFRQRDHALLMTLKGHAITWLKEQDLGYREGYQIAFWAALMAFIPGETDEAGMRALASPTVQEKLKSSYDWLSDGVEAHTLNLQSWWSPLYHLARLSGSTGRSVVPKV